MGRLKKGDYPFVRCREFITDQFYSSLTPDRDFPEHLRALLLSVSGAVAARVRAVNLASFLAK